MIPPTQAGASTRTAIDLKAKTVREAMQTRLGCCRADQPLDDIWRTMAERRLRFVVIVDGSEPGSTWGVISDLDLVAAASVRDIGAQVAAGSAARPAVSITPGATLERAAELMVDHDVTDLVVTDESTNPVGVLSTLDIVVALNPNR